MSSPAFPGPDDPEPYYPWSNGHYYYGPPEPDHWQQHRHPPLLEWLGERQPQEPKEGDQDGRDR
jgi:hypothetical protein